MENAMKNTRYGLALLAFVFLGLLAACGSDDSSNNNLNCDQFGNCSNVFNGNNSCQLTNNGCISNVSGVTCSLVNNGNGNTCIANNNGNNNNLCQVNPAFCNGGLNNGGAHGGLCVLDQVGNCRSTAPNIGYCYHDYYTGRCGFQSHKATNN